MSKVENSQSVTQQYAKKADEHRQVKEHERKAEIKIQTGKKEAEQERIQKKLIEDILGKDLKTGFVWKNLRFYRKEGVDQVLVDVVNRETGEVLKTLPEPELLDRLQKIKQSTGVIMNIHG